MSLVVSLTTRSDIKDWLRVLTCLLIVVLALFASSAFLQRLLLNDKSPYILTEVKVLVLITGIVAVGCISALVLVIILNKLKIIEMYYPKKYDRLSLSEDMISVDEQITSIHDLLSITVESDQYAGAPRGRSTSSGAGKVRLIYKGHKKEEEILILVQSAHELKLLRDLSAAWRSKGIKAFIID